MVLVASFFLCFLPETHGTTVDFDGMYRKFGKDKNPQGGKLNIELKIKNQSGAYEGNDGN
jgi:hypothetical protein